MKETAKMVVRAKRAREKAKAQEARPALKLNGHLVIIRLTPILGSSEVTK